MRSQIVGVGGRAGVSSFVGLRYGICSTFRVSPQVGVSRVLVLGSAIKAGGERPRAPKRHKQLVCAENLQPFDEKVEDGAKQGKDHGALVATNNLAHHDHLDEVEEDANHGQADEIENWPTTVDVGNADAQYREQALQVSPMCVCARARVCVYCGAYGRKW